MSFAHDFAWQGRFVRQLTPLEALDTARALLADAACWCRSAPARRFIPPSAHRPREWVRCDARARSAQRWCAAGALVKVSGIGSDPPGLRALEQAAVRRFGVGIGRANDDPRIPHPDLLACFDDAIRAVGGTAAAALPEG
jgi:hypothetical protein